LAHGCNDSRGSSISAASQIDFDTMRSPREVFESMRASAEALRRFRIGLPEPDGLAGGAPTRQALGELFVAALSARDTAALGNLLVTRAEFAYLYYPLSRDALSANGMPPDRRWELLELSSQTSVARALSQFGGRALTLVSLDCPNAPATIGVLAQHDGCTVHLARGDGSTFNGVLFGPIVEHQGHFKFIGYANDM
jgi:hypothetical protein